MDARESAGLAVHLEQCRECRGKLDQFRRIELELNRLPVEQPDPGLTDRIMLAIDTPPSHDAGRRPPIKRIRAELVNGYIALAATYLFVSTGVWQHIIAVSQVTLGIGVESRVHEAIELVVKLYRIFTA